MKQIYSKLALRRTNRIPFNNVSLRGHKGTKDLAGGKRWTEKTSDESGVRKDGSFHRCFRVFNCSMATTILIIAIIF